MSKDNYDFNDIDAILAEFRDADAPPAAEPESEVVPSPAPQADVFSFTQTAEEPAASELPEQIPEATVRFELRASPPRQTRRRVKRKSPARENSPDSADAQSGPGFPKALRSPPNRKSRRAYILSGAFPGSSAPFFHWYSPLLRWGFWAGRR